jgi:hypothetical protein
MGAATAKYWLLCQEYRVQMYKRLGARFGFEFAARRCVDDGTPMTEIAQRRTASIGLSVSGHLTSKDAQAGECRDRLERRWQ